MKKNLYALACALCTLLSLPVAAQVPAYVPTDGLVGWWPFNGNANDESGNGNDGVVNGAMLTEDRNGIANKAYSFNGIDNYINVPFSPAFNSIQDGLTMSAWVLMSGGTGPSTPPRVMELRGAYGNGGDAGFVMLAQDNSNVSRTFEVRWYNDYGNTNVSISPTNSVSSTVWHYLVYTADGNTGVGKFYVDGQFINDNSAMQLQGFIDSCNYNNNPLIIGAETNLLGLWGGKLDDIAIYNRALSEQEIQALYAGEPVSPPVACNPLPSNLQQGLVGYWPFCGNANDESGNGNDGTVNGATLTGDRFGNVNSAYEFDGINSRISLVLDNADVEYYSISVWFNAQSMKGGPFVHIGQDNGSNPYCDGFSIGKGESSFINQGNNLIGHYSCIGFFDSNVTVPQGEWNHCALIKISNQLNFYLNGVLVATEITNGPISPSNFGYFGSTSSDFSTLFEGHLDDIAIYNRALTPEEVQQLYTLDACTFTVYDTLYTYETVYDTLTTYETLYDTLITYETLYDTLTTYETVYDTLTTYETLYDTLTTYETIVDTLYEYETITSYDTVTTYITVTDTLLIDITLTGFEGQPSWLNTVTVFPNPASDHITIDYGNFALMNGYNTIITDAAGATVYSSAVNSQQVDIDINAWGAMGVYYMMIYDLNGSLVAVRQIVLE